MNRSTHPPCSLHLFVCTNRRPPGDALPSCADAGDEVYAELKRLVSANRLDARIWVTRTGCLGFCNKDGATVAAYPNGSVFTAARRSDARALLETTIRESTT